MATQTLPKPAALKKIEILRVGKHTASNGQAVEFTRADLEEIANSYNPALFKAALFVTPTKSDEGHAHDTGGVADRDLFNTEFAFGYPKYLKVKGDRLIAYFERIASKFVEFVQEGQIFAVSASVYLRDSRHNPTPGFLHLRHIAGLGKSPPAIKGLAEINLAEFSLVEFSSWQAEEEGAIAVTIDLDFSEEPDTMGRQKTETIPTSDPNVPNLTAPTLPVKTADFQASPMMWGGDVRPSVLFQKLREYLIGEKSLETAEAVVPESAIAALRATEDWQEDRASEFIGLVSERGDLLQQIESLNMRIADLQGQLASAQTSPPGMYAVSYAEGESQMATSNHSTKELGKRLKAAMSAYDMDSSAVAQETGISEQALNDILKGAIAPTQEQIDSLVEALDLDPDEMSTFAKKGGEPNPAKKGKVKPPNGDTPELSEPSELQPLTPPTTQEVIELSEEFKSKIAELEALVQQKDLEAKTAIEQVESLRSQTRQSEIQSFCENLVRDGKLTVAEIGDRVLSFGEGEVAEKNMVDFMASLTPAQEAYMREFLSDRAPVIDYSERVTPQLDTDRHTVSFSAAPGYEIDPERGQEYAAIASFCQQHNLDPTTPEQFRQGAAQYFARQNENL